MFQIKNSVLLMLASNRTLKNKNSKMKKLLIIALAFFSLNAMAQKKKTKPSTYKSEKIENKERTSSDEATENKIKKLTQLLDLTPEQQEKVRALVSEQSRKEKKSKLKAKEAMSSEKKMSKEEAKKTLLKQRESRMSEMNKKLKEILTEQQYARYEVILQKNKKNREKKMARKN